MAKVTSHLVLMLSLLRTFLRMDPSLTGSFRGVTLRCGSLGPFSSTVTADRGVGGGRRRDGFASGPAAAVIYTIII